MDKNKEKKIEKIFKLALENHQANNIKFAQNLYNKILEIDPTHAATHYNLGVSFSQFGDLLKAKACYEETIKINPNYINAHYNLGILFQELGKYQKARGYFEKTIGINPNHVNAHHNLGVTLNELGEQQKAKDCYERVIKINPTHVPSYWNSHTFASNVDEALSIINKIYEIDNKHTLAKIMICALEGFKGKFKKFKDLLKSPDVNHPYTRSIKWVFSLPKLPEIFFNRWVFFDAVIALADNSRPFYEFGVWNAISFQHLINNFEKGFGFDTFSGIPEDWHDESKGSYSSFGVVPEIEGGEFIVGKFEDTLPKFFSKEKPMASLINFDADLYSSTLCALNHSNKVIDEKTILVFDEFLMNDNWEEDEFKALNEFCNKLDFSYEVIAISLFTKQVAVKLSKN